MSHKHLFHSADTSTGVVGVLCHITDVDTLLSLGWFLTQDEAKNANKRETLRLNKNDNRKHVSK